MLSLAKILVVVVVGFAVAAVARRLAGGRDGVPGERTPTPPEKGAETLERCPVCGVYRLRGAAEGCDRADCPARQKS